MLRKYYRYIPGENCAKNHKITSFPKILWKCYVIQWELQILLSVYQSTNLLPCVGVLCAKTREGNPSQKREKGQNLTKMWKWRHGFWINQRRQNREVLEMWKWVGSRQDFHAEHVSRKGCFAVKNVQFGWHRDRVKIEVQLRLACWLWQKYKNQGRHSIEATVPRFTPQKMTPRTL